MASPRDLIKSNQRHRLSDGHGTFAGEIAETADNVTDEIQVIVPAFAKDKWWGPCRWMPRVDDSGETVLPSQGDACIVVLAETEIPGTPEPWIIAWWPEG